ncbi:MAG: VWA domain-containing protein [Pyrinomonadaceae bacterium]
MKVNLYAVAAIIGLALIGTSLFVSPTVAGNENSSEIGMFPTPTPKKTPEEISEVIQIDTELVNINVRVVDRNSRPINRLKPSDFTIMEDGIPQKIDFFSESEVPTNYSLVVDNSGSLRRQIEKVIEASKILVSYNKPQDETMVIRFVSRDKIEIRQEFTNKKEYVNDALDNFNIEGGQTAVRDAVYLAAQHVGNYEKSGRSDDRTRRALILVTDGEDRDSFYTEPQLFQMLREADVQIYVIGFIEDLDKEAGFIRKSEQSRSKNFLEKLATETGGKAYFPTGVEQLNTIAKEIASELRTQYSIGYIPSNDKEDGTFRQIRVSVTDGPGKEKRIALTKAGRTAGAVADPSKAFTKPNQ